MCCNNPESSYTDVRPQETIDLQKVLSNYLKSNVGRPAQSYPQGTALSAGIPAPATNAMDIINRLMGYGGFTSPSPITNQGIRAQGTGSAVYDPVVDDPSTNPWVDPDEDEDDDDGDGWDLLNWNQWNTTRDPYAQ